MKHQGECATDPSARDVCEGMHNDKLDDIIELCEVLRAVYALCGEDPQIAGLIQPALAKHDVSV